ncbi:MAG: hypothetical protein Q7T85_03260, partial [Nitrosomonas sp.]|nr:hypothetical protein [Nitrosomonas sp.]
MDLYASIPKESKQSGLITELRTLILNLYCGIRLLGFRRNVLEQVTVSHDQFILLLGFYGLTAFVASYVMTPNPVFDLFGLGYLSVELLITLLLGFVLTKLTGKQSDLLKLLVITYCILPFRYLISFSVLLGLPETLFATGYVI